MILYNSSGDTEDFFLCKAQEPSYIYLFIFVWKVVCCFLTDRQTFFSSISFLVGKVIVGNKINYWLSIEDTENKYV